MNNTVFISFADTLIVWNMNPIANWLKSTLLDKFHLAGFTWPASLDQLNLTSFIWLASLDQFHLTSFTWLVSLDQFHLTSFMYWFALGFKVSEPSNDLSKWKEVAVLPCAWHLPCITWPYHIRGTGDGKQLPVHPQRLAYMHLSLHCSSAAASTASAHSQGWQSV